MTRERVAPTHLLQPHCPTHHFAMRFSSTPRGARLARRLATQRLDAWGIPYDSEPNDALTLIVAELAANAVRHGRVPGRDFHLAVTITVAPASGTATVRVEVTDTRLECVPALAAPAPGDDAGRGLLLVEHLAHRWEWYPRADGPGKTVWAEYVSRWEAEAPIAHGGTSVRLRGAPSPSPSFQGGPTHGSARIQVMRPGAVSECLSPRNVLLCTTWKPPRVSSIRTPQGSSPLPRAGNASL